ncbi:MAG: peptidoglycan bridge formation glycyltransferase FemA/FemB family protein [Bacteroidota bacterium]
MEFVKQINVEGVGTFAKASYLNNFSKEYGWFLNKDAYLPAYIIKKYCFKYLCFTDVPRKMDGTLLDRISEAKYIEEVVSLCYRLDIDFIPQPSTHIYFQSAPQRSKAVPFGTYLLDLGQSEEMLFFSIKKKSRGYIKSAIRLNYSVTKALKSDDIIKCYNVLKDTLDKSDIHFFKFPDFEKYLQSLSGNYSLLSVFSEQDQCAAAVLIIYNQNMAYYFYGGKKEGIHPGINLLLLWEAILVARNSGYKYFNFVGARINPDPLSKAAGIQRFKEKFNGELQEGFTFKINFKPLKRKIFNTLVYLKTGNKNLDIIDQETARKILTKA